MAPVTEIATMPLKAGAHVEDTNSASHAVWQSILDTVSSQDGFQRLYWGRRVEAPNEITVLIDWNDIADHQRFIESTPYGPFTDSFSKILDSPAILYHAHLSPHPPAPATSSTLSPVTECLTLYHPTSVDTAAFEERWSSFRSALEQHAEGYKASSAGWVVEELEYEGKKNKPFTICIGWESVDAHMKYRETEHFKQTIGLLREGLNGIKAHHAVLQER